jgi:hypothetical protein
MWRHGGVLLLSLALAPAALVARQGTSSPMPDYVFRATTGLLVFHVRPEAAGDFEAVMARINQGLGAATDAVRRQQSTAWRMFKSVEALAGGAAVYVAVVDPVSAGADYDPVRMITELLPAESQDLYARLKAAVIRVERLSLTPLQAR